MVCPKHGDVADNKGWIPCYAGCDHGMFYDYEDDPLFFDPGDMSACPECRGEGGWFVCGECNKNNQDVEW